MNELPPELKICILSYIEPEQWIYRVQLINHDFYHIVHHPYLWQRLNSMPLKFVEEKSFQYYAQWKKEKIEQKISKACAKVDRRGTRFVWIKRFLGSLWDGLFGFVSVVVNGDDKRKEGWLFFRDHDPILKGNGIVGDEIQDGDDAEIDQMIGNDWYLQLWGSENQSDHDVNFRRLQLKKIYLDYQRGGLCSYLKEVLRRINNSSFLDEEKRQLFMQSGMQNQRMRIRGSLKVLPNKKLELQGITIDVNEELERLIDRCVAKYAGRNFYYSSWSSFFTNNAELMFLPAPDLRISSLTHSFIFPNFVEIEARLKLDERFEFSLVFDQISHFAIVEALETELRWDFTKPSPGIKTSLVYRALWEMSMDPSFYTLKAQRFSCTRVKFQCLVMDSINHEPNRISVLVLKPGTSDRGYRMENCSRLRISLISLQKKIYTQYQKFASEDDNSMYCANTFLEPGDVIQVSGMLGNSICRTFVHDLELLQAEDPTKQIIYEHLWIFGLLFLGYSVHRFRRRIPIIESRSILSRETMMSAKMFWDMKWFFPSNIYLGIFPVFNGVVNLFWYVGLQILNYSPELAMSISVNHAIRGVVRVFRMISSYHKRQKFINQLKGNGKRVKINF